MIPTILNKIFYDPRRHVKKLPFVSIGDDTVILSSVQFIFHQKSKGFSGNISIGNNSMVGNLFVFESAKGDVRIGDNTFINGGTTLICREKISIGSNVTIAGGCTIYDHNSHSLSWQDRADDINQQLADYRRGQSFIKNKSWATVKSREIIIEDKVWIGFNVTVLNGVRIGEGAIVGAGSVVRDHVLPWTMVYGNPAVFVKTLRE